MKRSNVIYYEATDGCYEYAGTIGIRKNEPNTTSDIIKEHIYATNKDVDLLSLKITMYYVVI